MDLITSVPTPIPSSAPPPPSPSSASPAAALPPPSSGIGKLVTTDRKSKRGTLSQIQSDTISAAKAALNPVRINILPQKQKQKKKVPAIGVSLGIERVFTIMEQLQRDQNQENILIFLVLLCGVGYLNDSEKWGNCKNCIYIS